jgi:hypothetical protein
MKLAEIMRMWLLIALSRLHHLLMQRGSMATSTPPMTGQVQPLGLVRVNPQRSEHRDVVGMDVGDQGGRVAEFDPAASLFARQSGQNEDIESPIFRDSALIKVTPRDRLPDEPLAWPAGWARVNGLLATLV